MTAPLVGRKLPRGTRPPASLWFAGPGGSMGGRKRESKAPRDRADAVWRLLRRLRSTLCPRLWSGAIAERHSWQITAACPNGQHHKRRLGLARIGKDIL